MGAFLRNQVTDVKVPVTTSRGPLFYTSREKEARAGTMAAYLGSGGPGLCFPQVRAKSHVSGPPWTKERGNVCSTPTLPDLSVPIVDPKWDCGGIKQQQELVLKHLLFEALDGPALPFIGFLWGTKHGWVLSR